MSEMVEMVARDLAVMELGHPADCDLISALAFAGCERPEEVLTWVVREVLQAVREPSDAMLASAESLTAVHMAKGWGNPTKADHYRAMIDAALND